MPFLGGLFSRKNKSSLRSKRDDHAATSSIHASELDSALSSPTTSYVTPDKSIPTYPNARNLLHTDSAHDLPSSNVYPLLGIPPSGKKLRLPFARKKNALPMSDLSIGSSPNVNSPNFDTSPRSANSGRVSSGALVSKTDPEELRRLRPPPSRSAIFAAYGDPTNSPSTHSLPDEASVVSELPFPSLSPFPQSSKGTSFFSWSKASTSKSSSSSPFGDPTPPTSPDPINSFNLKSFRHIRAPSPTRPNAPSVSLSTPIARPRTRGESINSESSQRISVAAFREAQARRSLAGSPSPSFRAPSPAPVLPPQTSTSMSPPQAVQLQNKIQPRGRHSSMALYTSDSDSSTSSDDGTEDETIKRRPGISHSKLNDYERKDKGKAKSEMGHKSIVDDHFILESGASQRAPQSHSGHSRQSSGQTNPGTCGIGLGFPPRSQSSLGHCTPAPKLQSSVSTTASSPSATVKLAGKQMAPTQNLGITSAVKPSREPPLSTHSTSQNATQSMNNVPRKYEPASDSESDSEDDAPLATLLGPRRPGSAMSSYSSLHARSTGNVTARSTRSSTFGLTKPLIDINELTGPKRSFTASSEKSTAGFTQGPTLLSGAKRSMSPTSLYTENASDLNQPLTRKAPPVKFISPPSSPANEAKPLIHNTVDGADNTIRSDLIALPSEKIASPEQPRDALTERLSRVVNLKFIPSSSNAVAPNVSRAKDSVPNQTESPNVSAGDTSDSSRQLCSEKRTIHFPSTKEARRQPSAESPPAIPVPKVGHSPPDEDLAQLLGTAGIKFMLRNGVKQDQSSESESEEEDSSEEVNKEQSTGSRIAPIPIKQRPPTSSFSVTSRPPLSRDGVTAAQTDASRISTASNVVVPRPRSITLTPSSTSSTSKISIDDNVPSVPSNVPPKSTSSIASPKLKNVALKPPGVRQRSSTMVTGLPLKMQTSKAFHVPERPFAVRRNSPASSTGDSSSGRVPVTPRDGSDIGVQDRKRDEWSGGASGLGVRQRHQHLKRRSVSFEEDHLDTESLGLTHSKGKEHTNSNAAINNEDREAWRKERRRGEAKAAIELGKVVNGPAPIVDDEDEMSINHNISPRMSTLNPMMGMGLPVPMQMGFGSRNSVAWGGNMAQPMSPYLMPPPADPNFLAAHQQAMMYAKQAYQMAVAQQAMAAAGDEWERGSAAGSYGGNSMIGAPSSPAMMSPHFGMIPMGQGFGWPSPSSIYLPNSSRGGSNTNSRSEYGGARAPNNWSSSKSSYGEAFGPPLDQYGRKNVPSIGTSGRAQRDSLYSSRVPVIPAAQSQDGKKSPIRSGNGQRDLAYLPSPSLMPASQFQSGRRSPDGTPRPRTGSQPASPSRSTYGRKVPPPSSWKAGM